MTTEIPRRREDTEKAGGALPAAGALTDVPVSRRNLLKGIGLGGATVVVAGTSVASYRVYDTRALDPGDGKAYDAWKHAKDPGPLGMVSGAILAANPHNAQPWRFHVTDTAIDLFADTSRVPGTVDGLFREMYVGLGCALENLVLGAAARGYHSQLTLLPDGGTGLVAHMALATGAPVASSPLYEAIGHRRSNRGPYRGEPVQAAVLTALAANTSGLGDVGVRWLDTPVDLSAMGTLMIDAARAVTEDHQQSVDAFAWYRSDDAAIERHKDGLTLDAQGLSAMTTAIGKLLPASSRTAGDTFWLKQTRTVHTRTAAAYGVITVPSAASTQARLAGGRLLQRIHLDVTARGLALQHMNQITERIDRESVLRDTATFGPRLARLLDIPGREALVAFRIGHPVRTARLSPRRPVADVVG